MSQIGKIILLCLEKVLQKRAGTDDSAVVVCKAETGKRRYFKMIQKLLSAYCIIKIPCIQRVYRDSQPVFHSFQIHTAHIERFIADDLRRREPVDLIHQLRAVLNLGHKVIPCRDISHRDSVTVRNIDNTHDVIVL